MLLSVVILSLMRLTASVDFSPVHIFLHAMYVGMYDMICREDKVHAAAGSDPELGVTDC